MRKGPRTMPERAGEATRGATDVAVGYPEITARLLRPVTQGVDLAELPASGLRPTWCRPDPAIGVTTAGVAGCGLWGALSYTKVGGDRGGRP
jgi:hypothetical protein